MENKPYLESRDGTNYSLVVSVPRREKIKLTKELQEVGQDPGKLEDFVYQLLIKNYPEVTREQYDDILDFNEENEGMAGLYELLGLLVQAVFQVVGTENTSRNLYLQEMRAKAKVEESTQVEEVEQA